jgi:tetratricopeptide (TPR) repeat protein
MPKTPEEHVKKPKKSILDHAYELFREQHDPKNALKFLLQFEKENKNQEMAEIHITIARLYISLDQFENAIKILEPYTKKPLRKIISKKNEEHIFITLCSCYKEQNLLDDAANSLRQIRNSTADTKYAWVRLFQQEVGHNKELYSVSKKYEEILSQHPFHISTLLSLASVYHEQEQLQESIKMLEPFLDKKMIRKNFSVLPPSKLGKAYTLISMCYLDLGNSQEALKYAKEATKIDPNAAAAWSMLGKCYSIDTSKSHSRNKSTECFNLALQLDKKRFNKLHSIKQNNTDSHVQIISLEDEFVDYGHDLAIAPIFSMENFPALAEEKVAANANTVPVKTSYLTALASSDPRKKDIQKIKKTIADVALKNKNAEVTPEPEKQKSPAFISIVVKLDGWEGEIDPVPSLPALQPVVNLPDDKKRVQPDVFSWEDLVPRDNRDNKEQDFQRFLLFKPACVTKTTPNSTTTLLKRTPKIINHR